jgi:hypothetical protein
MARPWDDLTAVTIEKIPLGRATPPDLRRAVGERARLREEHLQAGQTVRIGELAVRRAEGELREARGAAAFRGAGDEDAAVASALAALEEARGQEEQARVRAGALEDAVELAEDAVIELIEGRGSGWLAELGRRRPDLERRVAEALQEAEAALLALAEDEALQSYLTDAAAGEVSRGKTAYVARSRAIAIRDSSGEELSVGRVIAALRASAGQVQRPGKTTGLVDRLRSAVGR